MFDWLSEQLFAQFDLLISKIVQFKFDDILASEWIGVSQYISLVAFNNINASVQREKLPQKQWFACQIKHFSKEN